MANARWLPLAGALLALGPMTARAEPLLFDRMGNIPICRLFEASGCVATSDCSSPLVCTSVSGSPDRFCSHFEFSTLCCNTTMDCTIIHPGRATPLAGTCVPIAGLEAATGSVGVCELPGGSMWCGQTTLTQELIDCLPGSGIAGDWRAGDCDDDGQHNRLDTDGVCSGSPSTDGGVVTPPDGGVVPARDGSMPLLDGGPGFDGGVATPGSSLTYRGGGGCTCRIADAGERSRLGLPTAWATVLLLTWRRSRRV